MWWGRSPSHYTDVSPVWKRLDGDMTASYQAFTALGALRGIAGSGSGRLPGPGFHRNSFDSRRSASGLPPVWQVGQY
jgi:hypothetical protein